MCLQNSHIATANIGSVDQISDWDQDPVYGLDMFDLQLRGSTGLCALGRILLVQNIGKANNFSMDRSPDTAAAEYQQPDLLPCRKK